MNHCSPTKPKNEFKLPTGEPFGTTPVVQPNGTVVRMTPEQRRQATLANARNK